MSQLNSVWVFSDNPERYAELFGGAQQWGQQVYAIVQNTEQAQAVMPYGPKCIYVLEQNDALQRTENYAESIAALLKDKHPAMLLLAATKRGKALAARLSVQLNAALVNDATAVDIVDGSHLRRTPDVWRVSVRSGKDQQPAGDHYPCTRCSGAVHQ